ncbi:MAG: phage integrase N-terminal SAM-like domain-containing protein [Deltaproteobacteria bacterium]|nr:phage integrase N-terminal SAM-like domain-containing protein [Deltaproteobacteria bacterium]
MSESSDVQKSVERMQIHMELRGLRPNTTYTFANCARRFLAYVGKPPTAVTTQDVEGFLLDLARRGRSPRTRNVNLAAVRCLLAAARGDASRIVTAGIPSAKRPHRCPEILSGSEIVRLLAATDSPKYRAIFMLAYGAGLRVSEITSPFTSDIDSERMLIRARAGKTGPRHVVLSPRVLAALRAYWKAARPQGPELFPGGRRQPACCQKCQSPLRLIALIKNEDIAKKILVAMRLVPSGPRACPPCPSPHAASPRPSPAEVPALHPARPPPQEAEGGGDDWVNWTRPWRGRAGVDFAPWSRHACKDVPAPPGHAERAPQSWAGERGALMTLPGEEVLGRENPLRLT